MFKFLLKSLLTPEVIKSLLRHAIVIAGTALGYQAVMHGGDVEGVASALFLIGSTAYGWYDAHKAAGAKVAPLPLAPPQIHIELGKPTEEQITAELNREQLKRK